VGGFRDFPLYAYLSHSNLYFIQGHPSTEEGRRQAFELIQQKGEERITFNNFKKLGQMLNLNLTDDQVQDAIQSIAGKGKQHLTWEQFNAFLARNVEKKNRTA